MQNPPGLEAAAADVILRDGRTLRLRPPRDADGGALLSFFARLSPQSSYLRFHGVRPADANLVRPLLASDGLERGALVGVMSDDAGDDSIVAVAEWARLRDPRQAEAAFAVADELQGRGVGTRLLEQLAAQAGRAGVEQFVTEVLGENRPMLNVLLGAGFELTRTRAGGEVELTFPIAPTSEYLERVAGRDHTAVTASLRPFFEPAAVAVAGASPRRGSIGGELFRNILDAGYRGSAYPVNRDATPVAGVHAYQSIGDLPERPDLAVICVPGEHAVEAAESALRAGVTALCVISAGFAETGAEGAARQERLLALVRAHGGRLIGPNCLGIAIPPLGLNATFAPRALPPGRIGFSSQSGALGLALLENADSRGLGFSAFVSIGNKADVSSNDLLEWWEEDDATDLVLLYLESFGNPRKFSRVAGRVARRKPILALKAGSTRAGARAASSHTAALAGSDAAVDALFRQAGVLRARTLEELVDAATLLSSQPLPRGRRVGILTNAGGLGILCADACESLGLTIADLSEETRAELAAVLPIEASTANPVDALGSADARAYELALPPLLADDGVDAVIALFVPPLVARPDDVGAAIHSAAAASDHDKPVLAVVVAAGGPPRALRDATSAVAAFGYPESAVRALALAVDRAEWLRRPVGTVPTLENVDAAAARELVASLLADRDDAWLEPFDAQRLLGAYGFPLVRQRVVTAAADAVAFAREVGYPVVVKTAAAGVHKTEAGAVALDLASDADVEAAAARVGLPALVQPQIAGGTEFLVGGMQDPLFGPLVAFGPGGTLAELIGAAEFALAPLTDVDAETLLGSGKAGLLVAGFRGAPPASRTALADVLHRLSRLLVDLPEVAEVDLNPVIAHPSDCAAVDARIRVARPSVARATKTW